MDTSRFVESNEKIMDASTAALDVDGPGPQVMAAATLSGDKVVNPAGEDLGNIEKIMLDIGSLLMQYCLLVVFLAWAINYSLSHGAN